ncbi:MAG: hypothetical protein K2K16_03825 [Ruminococcus sp.]|nr:hypothetical protein [Ruminococcus sp.]
MFAYFHCNLCEHCRNFGKCESENEEKVHCTYSNDDPYDDCARCVKQDCFDFFLDLPYAEKNTGDERR